MIDPFHYSGNSSSFQIELITLWTSEQIFLPPALINYAGSWSIPGNLCLFSFPITISNSKALGSDSSCSGVRIFLCLTSPNTYTLKIWEKWFLHLAKILKESVSFLIFYCISSRLATLLKIIDVPIKVSDLFDLTVSFKFLNFSSQIFPFFFVPKMSASFMSYIVELSTLFWLGSCTHCILVCFLWSKKPKHSSSKHAYAVSICTDIDPL